MSLEFSVSGIQKSFQGILLDFDGTLADTMEDHFLAWQKTLALYGIDIQGVDYYPLEGMQFTELAAHFFKGHPNPPDFEEVGRKKDAFYLENHQFRFTQGAEEFVGKVRRMGIPMAIVTAGRKERLEKSCPDNFLENFKGLVTGEGKFPAKPNPMPYLKGAEMLELDPEKCLAVENAPLGVQSATGAGCACIGVTTSVGPEQLGGTDLVIEDLFDLNEKIQFLH